MKIIHCSDLHLESKLHTNFTTQIANQRNSEICRTFERMVEYAARNAVGVILLCGDIFDSAKIGQTTEMFLLDVIKRFPEIHFFYLRGNHDKDVFFRGKDVPHNLKLFGERWKYYRCRNVMITGIEITDRNAHELYNSLCLSPNHINIVLLHGQVCSESGIDKIHLSRLTGKHIDYLALGHIHSYQSNMLDHRGIYCYSGCLEGRGFDETDEKGFVLLDINNNSLHSEFIPFASKQFHKLSIEISNYHKITEILQCILSTCSKYSENDYFSVSLLGHNLTGAPIDTAFLQTILNSEYYYIQILDHSEIGHTATEASEMILRDEFMKAVYSDDSITDTERNIIIRMGLAALNGEKHNYEIDKMLY